jgi:hypothetical protein
LSQVRDAVPIEQLTKVLTLLGDEPIQVRNLGFCCWRWAALLVCGEWP